MKLHDLKTDPRPFTESWMGRKPYEIRKADRDFRVDDLVRLLEWEGPTKGYSGMWILARITYMTEPTEWGLPEDLCVLGLKFLDKAAEERPVPL